MNTTVQMDDKKSEPIERPGSQLAIIREKLGYSREYVAGKLHLRVRLIELLEEDDYEQMPQAVFVMGYFRAYAKLLGLAPEPYLESLSLKSSAERKPEKVALRQIRREINRNERSVRWISGIIVIITLVAVTFLWQKNKDGQLFFSAKAKNTSVTTDNVTQQEQQVNLTDISKMQSFFKSMPQQEKSEK